MNLDSLSEECLANILARRFQEAKALVWSLPSWSTSPNLIGRRAAWTGIITTLTTKYPEDGLIDDLEKLKRLHSIFTLRIDSIWCDDFERGYIQAWIRFIEGLASLQMGRPPESIVQNPDKEE